MSIKITKKVQEVTSGCSGYLVDNYFEEMLSCETLFMLPVYSLWYIEMFFQKAAKEDFKGVYEQIFIMNLNRLLKQLGKEEIYK